MVSQEERHRVVARAQDSRTEVVGFAVQAASRGRGSGSSGQSDRPLVNSDPPTCTHCGKLGHDIQRCYELYGYPANYGRVLGRKAGTGCDGSGVGVVANATTVPGVSIAPATVVARDSQPVILGLTAKQISKWLLLADSSGFQFHRSCICAYDVSKEREFVCGILNRRTRPQLERFNSLSGSV